MDVTLPFTVILLIVAWLLFRQLRLRWWVVIAFVLLGFYLADTSAAPVIDKTTRDGVKIINQTGAK
ncbi:ABC-type multidrug transport system permease subunit [Kitasatospora gansuensis]|uniref:ABC-type multidrug transport system permease subunit n=2 Tax=Kitasatospora TaxID=2063 RepID=A0A7W7SEY0_9ACTN|nr:hypothetical protein [Kitasatospora gansuensis]MBB4948653.1 ABC-type multidrug transport system permease subunit [Kitasatospora gansuensis]